MSDNVSGVPRLAWRLSLVAAAAFVLGPLGAHFGITPPMTGFLIFALGGILGLASLVLGLIGAARHTGSARGAALRGVIVGGAVAAVFVLLAVGSRGAPRINDITTDMDRPPRFVAAVERPRNVDRDMGYPGPTFAEQQRQGYPDLGPLLLAIPPDQAYAKARQVAAETTTWTVMREDEEAMAIEGYDTTALFRFEDDFVIEIRPEIGGSVVHMRSKSRDGQGDMGANAARIRAFFAKMK